MGAMQRAPEHRRAESKDAAPGRRSASLADRGLRHGKGSLAGPGKREGPLRCDELGRLAHEAMRRDDASFLADRRGPSLLLIGPDRMNLKTAVVVPLGDTPMLKTLGRHPENDIVAPWPSISRRHAALVASEDAAFLIDRGSANGTFLGTERLLPDVPRLMRDGDEVRFGDDLHAVFLTSEGLLATVRRLNRAA
jgi:hypothetical protein